MICGKVLAVFLVKKQKAIAKNEQMGKNCIFLPQMAKIRTTKQKGTSK